MKKFAFITLALVVSVYLFGYAKEEHPATIILEGVTETPQLSMENILSDLKPSTPLEVKDARVQDIQTALMITGYYMGPIDGKIGPLTKKAINEFQKENKLQVDNKVGKKTWASLRVQAIQKIQTALKNAGYYTAEIDGKMGPLTKKAIRDFQRDNNLQVDGKVGPRTWGKLSHYLNDLMAKQDCLSIYNKIYQIMDDEYYKDV